MNHYERIGRSVDYLEEHLREAARIEAAAEAAHLSVPQYYRMFHALTGSTVGDYLRKRRLSEAALALTSSDRGVLDVALEYGFESQEGFTRAFAALAGDPPGRYRRTGSQAELFPRLDIARQYFAVGGARVSPRVKVLRRLEPLTVAVSCASGRDPEGEAWDRLTAWAAEHRLMEPGEPYRLFSCQSVRPAGKGYEHAYEAWISLARESEPAPGIEVRSFPGGLYAVTSAPRLFTGDAWQHFHAWLRVSRYRSGPHQWLEEHVAPPGTPEAGASVDLYLPVLEPDVAGTGESMQENTATAENVQTIELAPMRVASYRALGREPEEAAMAGLRAWVEAHDIPTSGKRLFGFNNPSPTPGSDAYGYEFWLEVGPEVQSDGDVQVKDVPGGFYASAPCPSPENGGEHIPAYWKGLVQWAQAQGRSMGRHQWLEEHIPTPGNYWRPARLDLLMPLEK
jgi:AraC family transcriptional regulator